MDVTSWIERNYSSLCFPTTFIRYTSTIITSVVSGAASFTCIIRHDICFWYDLLLLLRFMKPTRCTTTPNLAVIAPPSQRAREQSHLGRKEANIHRTGKQQRPKDVKKCAIRKRKKWNRIYLDRIEYMWHSSD